MHQGRQSPKWKIDTLVDILSPYLVMEVIAKGGVGSSQISRRDVGLVVASRGPGAIVCFETAPGKNRISYQSFELYAAYLVGR